MKTNRPDGIMFLMTSFTLLLMMMNLIQPYSVILLVSAANDDEEFFISSNENVMMNTTNNNNESSMMMMVTDNGDDDNEERQTNDAEAFVPPTRHPSLSHHQKETATDTAEQQLLEQDTILNKKLEEKEEVNQATKNNNQEEMLIQDSEEEEEEATTTEGNNEVSDNNNYNPHEKNNNESTPPQQQLTMGERDGTNHVMDSFTTIRHEQRIIPDPIPQPQQQLQQEKEEEETVVDLDLVAQSESPESNVGEKGQEKHQTGNDNDEAIASLEDDESIHQHTSDSISSPENTKDVVDSNLTDSQMKEETAGIKNEQLNDEDTVLDMDEEEVGVHEKLNEDEDIVLDMDEKASHLEVNDDEDAVLSTDKEDNHLELNNEDEDAVLDLDEDAASQSPSSEVLDATAEDRDRIHHGIADIELAISDDEQNDESSASLMEETNAAQTTPSMDNSEGDQERANSSSLLKNTTSTAEIMTPISMGNSAGDDTTDDTPVNNKDVEDKQQEQHGIGNIASNANSFEARRQAQIVQQQKQQQQEQELQSLKPKTKVYRGTWGKKNAYEPSPDLELLYQVFEDRIRKELGIGPLPESMLRENIFPLGVNFEENGVDSAEDTLFAEAEQSIVGREGSNKSNILSADVNSNFVEGLDDIDKFFEGVDPPDELDVGASGSSMQDMLMKKGKEILVKRFRMGVALIRLGYHSARVKLLTKWNDLRSGKIDFKGMTERAWKKCQHVYEKVADFVDSIIDSSSNDEEEDFEAFKRKTMEDFQQAPGYQN